MDRWRLVLGAVVVAGLAVGVLLGPSLGPSEPDPVVPTAAPAASRDKAPAKPVPSASSPEPDGPAREEAQASSLPPLQRLPVSRPKDWPPVDPAEAEVWAAEAPVALHAAEWAGTWEELAWRFDEEGDHALAWDAMSLSARLRRAQEPVPQEEVTALLIAEIDLLRTLMFSSEQLATELEPMLQGAHHAIQGAPPPLPRD